MSKKIIVITGTPGIGKTTISEIVSRRLKIPLIKLAEFVKKERLYKSYDERTLSFIVDVERARQALKEYITSSEDSSFLIEGHLLDIIPAEFVDICIVLRLNPKILEKRLIKRKYPPKKIRDNVQSEILDYVLIYAIRFFGEDKVFEIDTTGHEINQVVEEVLEIIKKRHNGRPGKIDWMKELNEELEKYLRD
ncbi:MAG: hypothetical protein DRJ35_02955 [Thermoprotei archaeon]|nr:MAG: hypothetical protein DRJ35_02955 [Thermoprotei archaeon]